MDQPLLNTVRRQRTPPRGSIAEAAAWWAILAGWALAIGFGLLACDPFDDPIRELDPALRDSTLTALPTSDHRPAARLHILESFGSYGCVSCPDAEARLAPYIHPDRDPTLYNPVLIVVNYHVKFGSIPDPWVTPAIQAWNDRNGYVSLPQAVMDGSNARYGIREKDVSFKIGEYDSLAARAKRAEAATWLDLRLDTSGIAYDTSAVRIRFGFAVRNLDLAAMGALEFRILVVKNKPAIIPIYPTPWEVIVMETTGTDAAGRKLDLPGLPSLTAKAFLVDVAVPPETGKHVRPPPLGPETLTDYALIVLAQDANGVVLNAAAFNYGPK